MTLTFKTSNTFFMLDAYGTALVDLSQAVPGGLVVFFPSYKIMHKMFERWEDTGVLGRLREYKHEIFVEPAASAAPVVMRKFGDPSTEPTEALELSGSVADIVRKYRETIDVDPKRGAIMFAVCRGKVSEGIDFADDHARCVVLVGIPFPSVSDLRVRSKKDYNDELVKAAQRKMGVSRASNSTMSSAAVNELSGDQWYEIQGYRALNQAMGRCIRHIHDYGAVILMDVRFSERHPRSMLSKWVQPNIRPGSLSSQQCVSQLSKFFVGAKAHVESLSN